ncbi:thermonuclease family protein [Parvibaculum sp.]|uniref:thermonuclease family protein n=1 Tax=Parvibaculum sp. TaxID=2024848 RepID=UPI00391B0163
MRIAGVVDGDTLLLDDGREVRLKGIQAPKLPLGRSNFTAWPLADEAKARLEELANGASAQLRYGGARGDRHGRILAHVFVPQAGQRVWLQQAMLDQGLARVYTFKDNRACAALLLEVERGARAARRGIWSEPFYAIRGAADVDGLNRLLGRFEIVEGTVQSAALVRGRLYLNFGEDYRSDFTVTVGERDIRIFLQDGHWASLFQGGEERSRSLEGLNGKTVRVRGWLARNNGPEIVVTHPEQIEFTGNQD